MISFYRDILSGPLYIVIALLSLFFIMAIIGFMMERLKLAREEKEKIAYINRDIVTPINEVKVENTNINSLVEDDLELLNTKTDINLGETLFEENNMKNDTTSEVNSSDIDDGTYMKKQVIVFEDPDSKKE